MPFGYVDHIPDEDNREEELRAGLVQAWANLTRELLPIAKAHDVDVDQLAHLIMAERLRK